MSARKAVPWLVLGLLLVGSLVFVAVRGGDEPSTNDRVMRISAKLKCLVCDGESVAESNASFSRALRREIRRGIDEGKTDEQIIDGIAADPGIGERVRLEPPGDGIGALVWVVPMAALLIGGVGLGFAFVRWRRTPLLEASDADEVLVARVRAEPADVAEDGPNEPGSDASRGRDARS